MGSALMGLAWEDLRRTIAGARRPPLSATVVERRGDEVLRSASVLHDGSSSWRIETPDGTEFNDGRTVWSVRDGSVETTGADAYCANSWVKSLIRGSYLAYLGGADGEVLGQDTASGRPCWLAEVRGLRADGGATFRLWVDADTGILIRVSRTDDPGHELAVEDLRLGVRLDPSAFRAEPAA